MDGWMNRWIESHRYHSVVDAQWWMNDDGWTITCVQKDLVGNYPGTRSLGTSSQLLEIAVFVGIDPNWARTLLEFFQYPPIQLFSLSISTSFVFSILIFFSFKISCKNIKK
jgi:hypothetical protein